MKLLNILIVSILMFFINIQSLNLKISADGKFAVSYCDPSNVARVTNLSTGKLLYEIENDHDIVKALISTDNKFIITSSQYTIKVTDLGTGKTLYKIKHDKTYRDRINSILISSNNKIIISCSDKNVKVSELNSGKLLYPIIYEKIEDNNYAILSPDNKLLITYSDSTINLIDLNSGKLVKAIDNTARISSIKVSPNNKSIITNAHLGDEIIRAWDINTGKLLYEINHRDDFETISEALFFTLIHGTDTTKGPYERISTILSSDNKYVITSSDVMAKIHDLPTGKLLYTILAPGLKKVSLSPNNKLIITSSDESTKVSDVSTGNLLYEAWWANLEENFLHMVSEDGTSKVIDLDTGKTLLNLNANEQGVINQNFMRIKSTLNKTIKIIDLNSGTTLHTLKNSDIKSCLYNELVGHKFITIMPRKARVIDLKSGVLKTINHNDYTGLIKSAQITPDNKNVVTNFEYATHTNDLYTGALINKIDIDRSNDSDKDEYGWKKGQDKIDLDNENQKLNKKFKIDFSNRLARIIDRNTKKTICKISHGDYPSNGYNIKSVLVSKDNNFAITHSLYMVKVVDLNTGKELYTIECEDWDDTIDSVLISPNNKFVITRSKYRVRVTDLKSGKLLYQIEHGGNIKLSDRDKAIKWMLVSSNNNLLITQSDFLIKIIHLNSGKILHTIKYDAEYQDNNIKSILLSSDDNFLVSYSKRSVKVTNLKNLVTKSL